MGRKSGPTRVKRSRIPKFWKVPRKKLRFVYRVKPGPHPRERAYPLAVLIRDILKLVKTAREAEAVIKEGRVKIDGVVRREPGFPVGLMDSISIDITKSHFRVLPDDQGGLRAVSISAEEVPIKPLAVKRKTTVRKGQTQLGFHDGRAFLLGQEKEEVRAGDTVLLNLDTKEVTKVLSLKKGSLALLMKGEYGGSIAKVIKVNSGTMTSPPTVELQLDSQTLIVPKESVFVVGEKTPVVPVPETQRASV